MVSYKKFSIIIFLVLSFLTGCYDMVESKKEISLVIQEASKAVEENEEASSSEFDIVWTPREKALISSMEASIYSEVGTKKIDDLSYPVLEIDKAIVWKEILYYLMGEDPIVNNFGCWDTCHILLVQKAPSARDFSFVVEVYDEIGTRFFDLKTRNMVDVLQEDVKSYFPIIPFPHVVRAFDDCSDPEDMSCYYFYPIKHPKGLPLITSERFNPMKDKCIMLETPFSDWKKCEK